MHACGSVYGPHVDVGAGYCRTSRDTLLTKEVTAPTLFCMGAASPLVLGAVLGTTI